MIKLPKKNNINDIKSWLLKHKDMPIETLSCLSNISVQKLMEWKIKCDVIDINDEKIFRAWFYYKKYTTSEACVILNLNYEVYIRYLRKYKLHEEKKKNKTKRMEVPRTKEKLEELIKKYTINQIANMSGISPIRMYTIAKKLNVDYKKKDYNNYGNKCNNHKWLKDHYIDKQMTLKECGELAGVSLQTIKNWLISHGLKPRSVNYNKKLIGIGK